MPTQKKHEHSGVRPVLKSLMLKEWLRGREEESFIFGFGHEMTKRKIAKIITSVTGDQIIVGELESCTRTFLIARCHST